ncbi:glycosyltransferase family 39 protein [Acetomicrobium hydrogeniformans]|uniref:glycosyltransferase family 39 protein n=1 Tax=Acetomicrobium hydrogeniformans TaxID=649746 RepID=UPI0001BCA9FB|nr:glycosyltransferase family 39 protein [Acetomicrobium hydrogeniformans]
MSTQSKTSSRRQFLFVILLALLASIAFQGSRGLYETTEGRYAEVAREMLRSGNYLEPTLLGLPHWSKPPLTYWAIALGLKIFGLNAWGARFYLVISFVLTVICVWKIAQTLWDKKSAYLSAVVYTSSLMPLVSSNVVSTDTLLALWEALAIFAFWKAVRTQSKRWTVLVWLFLGMSFMTKGYPGLLPLLGIIPTQIYLRKARGAQVPRLLTASGMLTFIALGLGWYIFEAIKHPYLVPYWLGHEVVGRFSEESEFHNPHFYQAFEIYIPTLIFGTLPWSALLTCKFKATKDIVKSALSKNALFKNPQNLFLFSYTLLSLVLFFMAKSKLQLYILPLFLPLSLIMGRALAAFLDLNVIKKGSIIRILTISSCIFIVALKALSGTSVVSSPHDMKRLSASIDEAVAARSFQLLVVYDKKLNGLVFYKDEILDHINPGMSDQLSEKVIAAFRNGKTPVVLLRADNVDLVSDALRRSGIPITVKDLYGGWMLITCEQRS